MEDRERKKERKGEGKRGSWVLSRTVEMMRSMAREL